MSEGSTEPRTASSPAANGDHRLVRFVVTESRYVNVDTETAEHLLDPGTEYMSICEASDRFRRVAAQGNYHIDGSVSVEAVDGRDAELASDWVTPLDGTEREKYLWSARHFVMEARHELSLGRYREGHCPDLDHLNNKLAVLEDELRLMALSLDRPDLPEVKAWLTERAAPVAAVPPADTTGDEA